MNYKLIFACLAGSHLYGTNRPDSDIDIRGVCFPLRENILGMNKFEHWQPGKKESVTWSKQEFDIESDDICIYGLEKFMKLCADANPNIIELLFAEDMNGYFSDEWYEIRENRHLFLSQKIIHTFSGYVYSQLKRIKTHRKWLDNTPQKPNPIDYGYKNNDWTSRNRKNEYQKLLDEYSRYQTWKKTRNPKRYELECKYGYDSKHAMHLYRLIFECETLLKYGFLQFPLPEFDYLLRVYNGTFSYDEVVATAENCKDSLMAIPTDLPHKPNRKKINELLIDMQWQFLIDKKG